MKKKIVLITTITITGLLLIVSSCKKKTPDIDPPTMLLIGDNPLIQSLPAVAGAGTFTDPGAVASDVDDGNLNSSITASSTVNPNLKGSYTITYKVSDAAGNSNSITRTVNIVNDADPLAGTYSVSDYLDYPISTPTAYTETVTAHSTINNQLNVTKFGGYTNANVYFIATLTSDTTATISVPTQDLTAIGHKFENALQQSTAVIATATSSFSVTAITMKYKQTDASSHVSQANYTKQ